jgi:hypothetical protein
VCRLLLRRATPCAGADCTPGPSGEPGSIFAKATCRPESRVRNTKKSRAHKASLAADVYATRVLPGPGGPTAFSSRVFWTVGADRGAVARVIVTSMRPPRFLDEKGGVRGRPGQAERRAPLRGVVVDRERQPSSHTGGNHALRRGWASSPRRRRPRWKSCCRRVAEAHAIRFMAR